VGSSGNNTEIGLALGYNGIGRLLGQTRAFTSPDGVSARNLTPLHPASVTSLTNPPGPQRLIQSTLGGQAGWFVIVAAIGLVAVALRTGLRLQFDRRQQTAIGMGLWFLTAGTYVSVAGTVHGYYLAMLAPPVAALFAMGVSVLWDYYRQPGMRRWLLPGALTAAAAGQIVTLSFFSTQYHWVTLAVLISCFGGAALLVGCALAHLSSAPLLGIWIAVASLFLAPALWSQYTIAHGRGGASSAGPHIARSTASRMTSLPLPPGNTGVPTKLLYKAQTHDRQVGVTIRLVHYLETHRGPDKFIVGTFSAGPADAVIIASGLPVMDLGGFKAWDRILNLSGLLERIRSNSVRYFLVAADGSGAGVNADLQSWIVRSCSQVAPNNYGAIPADQLYLCRR
jgi:4-amino-4-deoxy-L-arabinose transferase-like glycosyltransferase